jgi:hypothetical protein
MMSQDMHDRCESALPLVAAGVVALWYGWTVQAGLTLDTGSLFFYAVLFAVVVYAGRGLLYLAARTRHGASVAAFSLLMLVIAAARGLS